MSTLLHTTVAACGLLTAAPLVGAAETVRTGDTKDSVATAVYSRTGNGYKRAKARDGSFKPEYYALSNGGRIYGSTSDSTVDRVTYPEVAEVAMKVLALQNYRYAQTKEQAKLLLVLNWGSTLAIDGAQRDANVANTQVAKQELQRTQQDLKSWSESPDAPPPSYPGADIVATTTQGFGRSIMFATNHEAAVINAAGSVDNAISQSLMSDRVRDQLNERNARIIGYLDDLAEASDIRRFAGGGDRYTDLITEVEGARYYIVISAYDFPELVNKKKQKLLWQTRVSVRAPGNAFNETYLAMLKSASIHFGQNSGRLVRGEESRGQVELGELKYLGEANPAAAPGAKEVK
jgi:hypothetical protein